MTILGRGFALIRGILVLVTLTLYCNLLSLIIIIMVISLFFSIFNKTTMENIAPSAVETTMLIY